MYKIVSSVVLLSIFLLGWLWEDYQQAVQSPMNLPEQGMVLLVDQGDNLKKVLQELENKKIIKKSYYLYWHARLQQQHFLILGLHLLEW